MPVGRALPLGNLLIVAEAQALKADRGEYVLQQMMQPLSGEYVFEVAPRQIEGGQGRRGLECELLGEKPVVRQVTTTSSLTLRSRRLINPPGLRRCFKGQRFSPPSPKA